MDPFSIYVWALQTGKLTDVLTGHEAPVSGLCFSSGAGLLASSSWDKTVRLWDLFKTGTSTETLHHGGDVLAVAFRPDGEQLVSATVKGDLVFWNVKAGAQICSIDAKGDIHVGRKASDLRTAASNDASAHFTSVAYTADGECVLAAGQSRFICLYAVAPKLLLRRWQVTHNRSLDGILDKLNSKGMGEGGPLALLDLDSGDALSRKK
jgi:periodic tryptophan protein 2